jgi:Uma2 family endonuclease
MTEAEFLSLPEDGYKYELVEGEARIVAPVFLEHDGLVAHVIALLTPSTRGRGTLYASSAGFRMRSGNIRCPDVSFMRKERLPGGRSPRSFGEGAPDLVVEVISPSEERVEVQRKLKEYFQSGAEQVWQMFPETQRLLVFTSPTEFVSLEADDELVGGDLLPGFTCRVGELFEFEE